jgi:hypothetical protein
VNPDDLRAEGRDHMTGPGDPPVPPIARCPICRDHPALILATAYTGFNIFVCHACGSTVSVPTRPHDVE